MSDVIPKESKPFDKIMDFVKNIEEEIKNEPKPTVHLSVLEDFAMLSMNMLDAIYALRLSTVAYSMLDHLLTLTQGRHSITIARVGVFYGIRPLARILNRSPGEIQRGDKQLREAGIIITTKDKRRVWVMHPSVWTKPVTSDAKYLSSIDGPHGPVLYTPEHLRWT